jgi:hypothetical protein
LAQGTFHFELSPASSGANAATPPYSRPPAPAFEKVPFLLFDCDFPGPWCE